MTLKPGRNRSKPHGNRAGATRPAVRRSTPAAARPTLKRSSPHPSEARSGAQVLAPLPAEASRMVPRFPEDDYDYGYLHDFLALPYVPRDCRAVVFGCGKGEEAVYFSERGYRVTGIDSDRNSIGLARERAWLNSRDIDFMIGDVFESAGLLPAESFGLATDRSVFRAIQGERERRNYLDLVRRLLLPGGVFYLTATVVDPARTPRRRRRGKDDLLVQEGGEIMGEVLRSGLAIVGRRTYPVARAGSPDLVAGDSRNGEAGALPPSAAHLMLHCRK